jgi:hypothetical protein
MDKKKIFIGLGIIAVIGGIYYFYNKSKNANTGNSGGADTSDAGTTDAGTPATQGAGTPATESAVTTATKKALTSRKDKKKVCGRRPVNKTKRAEWQKCVDAGGTSSFQGDFDEFEESYLDFDNSFDISF